MWLRTGKVASKERRATFELGLPLVSLQPIAFGLKASLAIDAGAAIRATRERPCDRRVPGKHRGCRMPPLSTVYGVPDGRPCRDLELMLRCHPHTKAREHALMLASSTQDERLSPHRGRRQ